MNTRFTIEEENIVAIYAEDSRETTLENILAAMPYMDEDMRQLAAAAVNKLQAMTDSEFSEREFILTDVSFANPRSFSQLTTSFLASKSLGIPHTPLLTFFFRYAYPIVYA